MKRATFRILGAALAAACAAGRIPSCPRVEAQTNPPRPLAFVQQADRTLTFDTGMLRGRLHSAGRSLGLTDVVYTPQDLRLDKDPGLLGYYRVFSGTHRYQPDARSHPSSARVLPDGRAELNWESAPGRPFAISAVYTLVDASTVELETTVTARTALPAVEVFLANYCSAAFSVSRLFCRAESGPAGDRIVAASPDRGAWQMAPRDAAASRLARDGRWQVEPNPVDWAMLPEYALPMTLRRDPSTGVSLLFMTRPEECIAVATPQENDPHYSGYFSLFGGDFAEGESRRTVSRMTVAGNLSEQAAVETVQAFLRRKPSEPARGGTTAANRRILLVTGQDYPGHLWRQTTPALRAGLEEDRRLSVSVIEDPALLDSGALDTYDAVVLHFMNWEQPPPPEAARERLLRRVRDGMGLVLVHFACGAFQDWPRFEELAGRVWDPKLRGHDPYGVFRVEIADAAHPVTVGLPGFDTVDELYTCLTGNRPVRVLARARSSVDGKDYPMAFTLEAGRGRVFHTVLGHDAQSLRNPGAGRLIRRGTAWAAGLTPEP
jgi:uncharacterized protein